MKLVYKGKFNGVVEEFASAKKVKDAVMYKEADSVDELSKIIAWPANILQIVLFVIVMIFMGESFFEEELVLVWLLCSFLVSLVLLVPHEILHALCFRGEVHLYQNLKQLMLFIVGEEHISKARFIFMSLLPNLVFGFIPFIVFLINPSWYFLGFLGMFCIPCGMGDYYNVYNTIRQVPNGAKVFMNGLHTYWYISEKSGK